MEAGIKPRVQRGATSNCKVGKFLGSPRGFYTPKGSKGAITCMWDVPGRDCLLAFAVRHQSHTRASYQKSGPVRGTMADHPETDRTCTIFLYVDPALSYDKDEQG